MLSFTNWHGKKSYIENTRDGCRVPKKNVKVSIIYERASIDHQARPRTGRMGISGSEHCPIGRK